MDSPHGVGLAAIGRRHEFRGILVQTVVGVVCKGKIERRTDERKTKGAITRKVCVRETNGASCRREASKIEMSRGKMKKGRSYISKTRSEQGFRQCTQRVTRNRAMSF
jgi:hypothetical protein